jgi:hypothetical protein
LLDVRLVASQCQLFLIDCSNLAFYRLQMCVAVFRALLPFLCLFCFDMVRVLQNRLEVVIWEEIGNRQRAFGRRLPQGSQLGINQEDFAGSNNL